MVVLGAAILKGWIDRVFVNGAVYGKGRRMDRGGLKGRRAMLVVSTGCYPDMVAPDGLLGDLNVNLWHLHSGTLAYAGFKVLPPFMTWSIHYTDEAQRRTYIDQYEGRLRSLDTVEPLVFHPLSDFGNDWKLKPGIASKTVGQIR